MNNIKSFITNTTKLSASEEAKLISMAQNGDKKAEKMLVDANMLYVVSVANKFYGNCLTKEDLIVDGCIGLVRAIRKFNVKSGNKLITYARSWIEKEIRDDIYDHDKMIALPQNVQSEIRQYNNFLDSLPCDLKEREKEEMALEGSGLSEKRIENLKNTASCHTSLDAFIGTEGNEKSDRRIDRIKDSSIRSAEDEAINSDLREKLEMFLSRLTEEESFVIRAHSGYGFVKPMSLSEIGDVLGISKSEVRNIENRVHRIARKTENRALFDGHYVA